MANARRDAVRPPWWRHWYWVPVGIVALLLAFAGYADRSGVRTVEMLSTGQITVINSAGPVRVRQGTEPSLTITDSWLVQRPTVELSNENDQMVLRVSCGGRGPCRAAVDLVIDPLTAPDARLVVMATGLVEVDRYRGRLTAVSLESGVVLGPIEGSARVLAADQVDAYGLTTEEIDVAALDGDIDLDFAAAPLFVFAQSQQDVTLEVPDLTYRLETTVEGTETIEVDSVTSSARRLVADVGGDLVVTSPSSEPTSE